MTDREKAIVMAYTGYTMLAGDKLGIYYQYVQEKLGQSVMTHELAYEEVQDAIKEAAKEDFIALAKDNDAPCNGWISVNDKLPEDEGDVLVYGISPRGRKKTAIMNYLAFEADRPRWALDGIWTVLYWMPIPEPLKEGQNADD